MGGRGKKGEMGRGVEIERGRWGEWSELSYYLWPYGPCLSFVTNPPTTLTKIGGGKGHRLSGGRGKGRYE